MEFIALPLQGQAVKNGNSAFVDENWNAYPNQWEILLHGTEKLGVEDIETYMAKWQQELAEARGRLASPDSSNRPKPWKKKCEFLKADVVGKLHLVLSDGLYVFVTLFLAVIVSIPMVLLKAGEEDSIVGITSVVFMFLPLISTLITKRVTKDESKIPFKFSIKDNLKYLAISAFLPGVCIVSGAVIYFVCFPNQLDLNMGYVRNLVNAMGQEVVIPTITVDVSALTDYDQMKDKLIMEVVSAEANADMLDKVPHF